MKKISLAVSGILLIGIAMVVLLWYYFGPPEAADIPILFVVPANTSGFDTAVALKDQRLVRHIAGFNMLFGFLDKSGKISGGGYRLNRNMNTWQTVRKILSGPDYLWVTVPEGMRREAIGELLQKVLGWDEVTLGQWNTAYSDQPEYREGVYFPDTYLLPRDESGLQIAQRFIDRFDEKVGPMLDIFSSRDIKWTTGIKIASLIQREAAGPHDMPLIAGIIWNRLEQGMKLDIDATLQYMRGKVGDKWWANVDVADKSIDSPYNTYIYKGLPPTPIANPGLDAIQAVLNPEETDCLFYLHADRKIHCAESYEKHKENIDEFLR